MFSHRLTPFVATIMSFALIIPAHAAEIKISDLQDVDYTRGSLANPHVVRVGEVQARGGRVAVLERVYDVSASARSKQWELGQLAKLAKKYGEEIPAEEITYLMTAERTLAAQKKFKQHIRVWDAQRPGASYTIPVAPVWSALEPEVAMPLWVLEDKRIVVMQPNADRSDAQYFAADFKTKKLKKIPAEIVELPAQDGTRTEGAETISHATMTEPAVGGREGLEWVTGEFTITPRAGSAPTVARYPIYEMNEEDREADLHPLITELGFAGVFVKGYTRGMFVMQMGVTETTNIMNNEVPESEMPTVADLTKLITDKWKNPEAFEFGTFQVVGYRLHK